MLTNANKCVKNASSAYIRVKNAASVSLLPYQDLNRWPIFNPRHPVTLRPNFIEHFGTVVVVVVIVVVVVVVVVAVAVVTDVL